MNNIDICENLHLLLNSSIDAIVNKKNCNSLLNNLKSLKRRIIRITSMLKREDTIKIGIFGAPSRGKSTLINALLDCKILPVSMKPGLTKSCIEVGHSENQDMFKVNVINNEGGGKFNKLFSNIDKTSTGCQRRYKR